ncbi:Nitric-oxide reductase large subunit [Sulfidibacter corallicola]|uniref:Nitric-oxide reductase large subunit n=1 Tax=Sulfidibacter corallicola TaxID=2818388 RepID=A0A8A4TEX0_SULCO|nr:nitric-oxide reductase large subunit [Sulfidibacter corallicola]QTD48649.1 nitric-oxide reductase large subunit [Sulfidibacter corallicola]
MTHKSGWLILASVLVVTFAILGFFGREIYRQAPPIPAAYVDDTGTPLFTRDEILEGQRVWQSIGGQQLGSVWGHGAYQAPDWTADWLHRELVWVLKQWSEQRHGQLFESLSTGQRAALEAELTELYRTNTYDAETEQVLLAGIRVEAAHAISEYYQGLFGGNPHQRELREAYAIHEKVLPDPERRRLMTAFFYWSAWSAATERPDQAITYTNNWPHEPLIGNRPSTANLFWSIVSIVLLLAAVGALVWYESFKRHESEDASDLPKRDPLDGFALTPSMRALGKYVAVVVLLFGLQVLLGALVAHYTVEGQHFFGIPIAEILPYSLARTWHIQLALFWIATSFLTAGLFLAPIINGGKDPAHQKLGVQVLFGALLVVVGGSLVGEFLAIHQKLDLDWSFWIGIQGYEYTDLGRIWQIALLIGLGLWLVLMLRGILPKLKQQKKGRDLLLMFTGASVAIGLFYTAGLFYGAKTHLSIMEYWRWWVVHLWVEGFFEVFATTALAFIFANLGLVRQEAATRAVLLSTSIFLVGGIPGTFHHIYFSGTPVSITAIGACFSALEVVPLVLIGKEAWDTYRKHRLTSWMEAYRWPIMFFVGVAFWNLVGAGVFGFLINPPIALFYMQGLNTTAVHAHGATFGVYGLLSLGLILFVARRMTAGRAWNTRWLAFSFWALNIGLGLMIALSLLPIGLIQTWASVEHGLWYARSADLLQTELLETLRWMRIIGDTVFLMGVGSLAWFMAGLRGGWSYVEEERPAATLIPEPS